MGNIELFIIAIGLSMDAFAVSICKGVSIVEVKKDRIGIIPIYFAVFQGFMPILGYLLGYKFQNSIQAIDHWIAFFLLGIIGLNMIKESKKEDKQCEVDDILSFKNICILSIATSIDALAIGITFAFLNVSILKASFFISITTFILSKIGVKIGYRFGNKFKSRAEFFGGIILIAMGLKILIEHIFIK